MNRAAIVLLGMFCALSAPLMMAETHGRDSQAATSTTPPTAVQDQGTAPPAQNPPAATPAPPAAATAAKTPAGQTRPATATRPHHRKRALPANCGTVPATAGQTDSGSTAPADPAGTTTASTSGTTPGTSSATPSATSSATSSATASAHTNCPPPKVIVRHGGTSEPSVQLAGGAAGNQASHQRDTANQMLESTEANLKKIAGRQLSSNQQDMVNQIRQFMGQSKAAVDAGDLDRARTLAWKAQLLSEDLLKPEK